ncbi:hypothetical protein FN846DRAFT_887425 [Sphaerosporella brunnea]|uniref:Uncharacterized protein n=1 Tax=Sphaerosporella brunnea TaxID=1250544 RepID=A0A5J5F5S1_9PEZI|nr:hypothetical protein FN846DRAFT_887425 [Sphaerosporella brunnea]
MQVSQLMLVLSASAAVLATPYRPQSWNIDVSVNPELSQDSGYFLAKHLTGDDRVDKQDCCHPNKNCSWTPWGTVCTKCGDGTQPTPYCGYGRKLPPPFSPLPDFNKPPM